MASGPRGQQQQRSQLHYTSLVQTNDYVHAVALDFSKAFDTVRHSSLVRKWADFWKEALDQLSSVVKILHPVCQWLSASIIHGSAVGPTAYVSNTSDLHLLFPDNLLFKNAEDTYRLVLPSQSRHIPQELLHVAQWADRNNLKLNTNKSQELIEHSTHRNFKP